MLGEVRSMKAVIHDIKTDLSNLKIENEQIKINMNSIRERQTSLAELLGSTNENVEQIQESTENMALDISHVNDLAVTNAASLTMLKADLERVSVAQISSNMRIFGLNIKETDPEITVKQKIIKDVLKKANPSGDWVADDNKRVHIVTNENADNTFPIVIVHFRYDDDKLRVYKGRDELRGDGIRVGDDLTYRQRQKLKSIKGEGKTGYFYKGKLCIRDESRAAERVESEGSTRAFKTAVRRQPQNKVHDNLNTAMDTDETKLSSSD